ncbi:aspartic proteinase nepenthesin-1-like [Solanum lycopersicum]|uniref:aspartic proteinase nepenthesin-1-like n=1 Tax=Solanum lycopersicum TaxID=4081 RepID=UPI0037485BB7
MEKFLHIHLLISIIFSILIVVLGYEKSFSFLNSSYIKDARERFMSFDTTNFLDPPRPSYTFSIYNRALFEKSKFKDYDSLLESKLARSQARANHFASILENGNSIGANGTQTRPHESKREVPKTTSVHLVEGEYVATFTIGSEETKSYLLIDTGSDLVWWQCKPCRPNKCYSQNNPIYDSTKSRTYRQLDCIVEASSCHVESGGYQCSVFGNECLYDYKYVDGSMTKGWIAEDVITFYLDLSRVRILFGCGIDQMSGRQFNGEFSGIAGLGRRVLTGGYSLPSQLEADIMAMCLPGTYSMKASTISFHTTPFNKTTSARLVPTSEFPNFYFVNLYKIFIDDKELPSFPSLSRNHDMNGDCIVDTGTIMSRFPRDYYILFRDTFRKEVEGIPMVEAPLGDFDTCYIEDPGVVPTFPVVKMYFAHQSPDNLLLLQQLRVVVHIRGLFCLAFLPWDLNVAMLGNHQLQGIGLTFDTGTNTLSFDLDAC